MSGARKVTDWAIGCDAYAAPELGRMYLEGTWPDGKHKTSARIVKYLGPRRLLTASGSVYDLDGDPSAKYAAFMSDAGKPLDLDNPLGFKGGDDGKRGAA